MRRAASRPRATSTSRYGSARPRGVHDTLTTTASAVTAVYVTRVRQLRKQNPTAVVLRIDL